MSEYTGKSCYSMWSYWRDKYGHVDAVEDYFPIDHLDNPEIQQAVAMIKNGERALDMIFEEMYQKSAEYDND